LRDGHLDEQQGENGEELARIVVLAIFEKIMGANLASMLA
jgi:hypothetical protein